VGEHNAQPLAHSTPPVMLPEHTWVVIDEPGMPLGEGRGEWPRCSIDNKPGDHSTYPGSTLHFTISQVIVWVGPTHCHAEQTMDQGKVTISLSCC
jgi:hypothetical protein